MTWNKTKIIAFYYRLPSTYRGQPKHKNGIERTSLSESDGLLLNSRNFVKLLVRIRFSQSPWRVQRIAQLCRTVKRTMQRSKDDFESVRRIHRDHPVNRCRMAAFVLYHKVSIFIAKWWITSGMALSFLQLHECHSSSRALRLSRCILLLILIALLCPTATYGATSPCVQRGRFAVIPEEPSGSPSVNETVEKKRAPSPDWDFTIEVIPINCIKQHTQYYSHWGNELLLHKTRIKSPRSITFVLYSDYEEMWNFKQCRYFRWITEKSIVSILLNVMHETIK